MNIQGWNIEVVGAYRNLGAHLNNEMDWLDNIQGLYKNVQSRLYLLRRLQSFGPFYDSVVASAIFYGIIIIRVAADSRKLNRRIRKLDSVEPAGERRMTTKLS